MATLSFESSLSSSAMRPPLSSADAPSMADTLPSINFGFEDLRDRMAKFTMRFDEFIERGRKHVLEERNQFRMNVTELQEDQRLKRKSIEILSLKSQTHAQILQKEAQETAEMHAAISAITLQRNRNAETRDRLLQSIAATQKAIDEKLAAQRDHAKNMDAQASLNGPELEFWENNLGMRIEGAGMDGRIKFVFDKLVQGKEDQEGWVELDLDKRDYEIVYCRPKLDKEELNRVLDRLNETRALAGFLKDMRGLFVKALQ
ncbi:MAG: kinetochore-associated Ndc80 complex subunit spc25 [Cirrosporium novae-zelandiae]|nr:MAG: kinetochore-associated Ndc80 complex subunit spc25 [Cirrosporium novae-zelandiae]